MADGVFNIAKGRVNELHDIVDGGTGSLIVVLLKAAQADGTLEDYDTLSAVLAAANTEADFTNYGRKELVAAGISASTVDDTNNWRYATIPDQTWTTAGGATNNTLVKMLICYDPDGSGTGTDTTVVPMTHHDFAITTNGGDLTADVGANGYFRAS